jgi:hypothetical protein
MHPATWDNLIEIISSLVLRVQIRFRKQQNVWVDPEEWNHDREASVREGTSE